MAITDSMKCRLDRSVLAPWLGVSLLCALCYFPGIGAPYIFDSAVWLGHKFAAEISGDFAGLYEAVMSNASGPLRRPLSMLSFALEAWIGNGMSPRLSNSINLGVHMLNAGILLLMTRRLVALSHVANTGTVEKRGAVLALLVSLLWLLHPLHVSTVLYAVQRMSLLSAMFVLFGLLTYVRQRERFGATKPTPYALSVMFVSMLLITLCAILCKESGVLLPWFVALIECFVFKCKINGQTSRQLRSFCIAFLLLPPVLILLGPLVAPEFFQAWYQRRDFDVWQRLLSESRVLWVYLKWILWPASPEIGFFHDDLTVSRALFQPWSTFVSLVAWVAVATVAYRARYRLPVIAMGVSWYLLAHAVESSVIPLELVFEHRNYLAMIGPIWISVELIERLCFTYAPNFRSMLALFACGVFAALLFVRASVWGDELQLAQRNLLHHPHSARSLFHSANAHLRYGESRSSVHERRQHILVARQQYESLKEFASSRVTAIVALLYIDEAYFRQANTVDRWLQELEVTLQHTLYDATEHNAFGMLVDCAIKNICRIEARRMQKLLDTAIRHDCCGSSYLNYQAGRYFVIAGNDPNLGLRYLETAIRKNPGFAPAFEAEFVARVKLGQPAQAIAVAMDWLHSDILMSQTATVMRLIN